MEGSPPLKSVACVESMADLALPVIVMGDETRPPRLLVRNPPP
jgi:hypothetical protein